MEPKDAMILAQVAAKVAGEIHAGTGDMTTYLTTIETVHNDLLARAGRGASPSLSGPSERAAANVAAVFPTATPAVAPGPVAPAISTGNDKEDAMWADLLKNPDNWYNNVAEGGTSLTGGAKPDFRHKTLVDPNGKAFALWLVSRKFGRTAPDAVFAKFGYEKPGAVQQIPAAGTPAPAAPAPFDSPF